MLNVSDAGATKSNVNGSSHNPSAQWVASERPGFDAHPYGNISPNIEAAGSSATDGSFEAASAAISVGRSRARSNGATSPASRIYPSLKDRDWDAIGKWLAVIAIVALMVRAAYLAALPIEDDQHEHASPPRVSERLDPDFFKDNPPIWNGVGWENRLD